MEPPGAHPALDFFRAPGGARIGTLRPPTKINGRQTQLEPDATHLGEFSIRPLACGLQGRSEFGEGTSAKWIFDVEIKKLRAEIF
jgi:hypothetical protein